MNVFYNNAQSQPETAISDAPYQKKGGKNAGAAAAKKALKRKQTTFLIVMLTVPVLHWLIFWLYVNVSSILLAFQTKQGVWSLNNFSTLFHEFQTGGTIAIALKNTLRYFCNNLLIMAIALAISYFMYRGLKGSKAFRIIFYLPGIISSVALTTVFAEFISSAETGAYGTVMRLLGKQDEMRQFLADSSLATKTILFYCVWTGFGTNILLFTGAMRRIPVSLIESAQLDGCGMLREIFVIILPLIWPTVSTLIVLNCTSIFSASGPILLFTQGKYKTTTVGYWIFDMVYNYNNYNIVSAAGLFFTCIGVPFILLIRWLIDKVPSAEY
ncbi:MAG: carbohydrate ABC transporter permease [Candidatus Scatosoma sp.]